MTFTCTGTITAWIFRVRHRRCEDTFGQFEIWRPDRVNTGVYTFVNRTAITEPEQVADDVYQEVLDYPIKVKENDTVGILVTSSNCRLSVLDVDSRAPAAYFRNDDVENPIFILDLARDTREIIPLITPVISSFPATSSTTLSYPEPTPTNPLLITTYSLRSGTTRAGSTLSFPQLTTTNPILLPATENIVQITSTVTQFLSCFSVDPSLSPSPDPQNPDASTEAHSKDPAAIVGISAGVGAVLVIGIIITIILTVTFKVRSRKTSPGNQSMLFVGGQHGELQTQSLTHYTEYTPPTATTDIAIGTNEAYGVVHINPQVLGPIATSGNSQTHRYGIEDQVSTIHNEAYGVSQTGQTAVMDDGLYMNSESMYDEPRFQHKT